MASIHEIAYAMAWLPMDLDLALGAVRMDINTAIPCGLLVNEAMTNIAKRAYLRLEPLPGA